MMIIIGDYHMNITYLGKFLTTSRREYQWNMIGTRWDLHFANWNIRSLNSETIEHNMNGSCITAMFKNRGGWHAR